MGITPKPENKRPIKSWEAMLTIGFVLLVAIVIGVWMASVASGQDLIPREAAVKAIESVEAAKAESE